jgi:hypothetical protein
MPLLRVIRSMTSVKLSPGFLGALSLWYASSGMAMFLVYPFARLCVYVRVECYEVLEVLPRPIT